MRASSHTFRFQFLIHKMMGLGFTVSEFSSTVDFTGLSSVQFSRSVMSDSLRPHEPQHARLPCPSPTPKVHPNPCPLSWWCHPAISSCVVPFSSRLQSFPASGSFQMSLYIDSNQFENIIGKKNPIVTSIKHNCKTPQNKLIRAANKFSIKWNYKRRYEKNWKCTLGSGC